MSGAEARVRACAQQINGAGPDRRLSKEDCSLTALGEDPGSVPSTQVANCCPEPQLEGDVPPSCGLPWHCRRRVQFYAGKAPLTHLKTQKKGKVALVQQL